MYSKRTSYKELRRGVQPDSKASVSLSKMIKCPIGIPDSGKNIPSAWPIRLGRSPIFFESFALHSLWIGSSWPFRGFPMLGCIHRHTCSFGWSSTMNEIQVLVVPGNCEFHRVKNCSVGRAGLRNWSILVRLHVVTKKHFDRLQDHGIVSCSVVRTGVLRACMAASDFIVL